MNSNKKAQYVVYRHNVLTHDALPLVRIYAESYLDAGERVEKLGFASIVTAVKGPSGRVVTASELE